MRYVIESNQKFTKSGSLGAWLFICAPFVAAFGLLWLVGEQQSLSPHPAAPAVMVVVASIAFLAGTVMIVIGRSQTHTVTALEVHGANR